MTIEVIEFIQSFRSDFLDFFFNMISFLGEEYVYILLLAIIYYTYDKKLGEFLSFSLFFAGVLNSTLKVIVAAGRPFVKYPNRVVNLRPDTAPGFSFPSGHTQNFTTFLFSEAFWTKKRIIFVVATILSLFMAISRMYLGVHFLEDVVVSLLLGVSTAYVLHRFYRQADEKLLHKVYIIILVITLPFVIILGNESLFKAYGLMLGFTFAMMYEKKYVKFTLDVSVPKKIIRILSGLIVMLAIQVGLGMVFDSFAEEGTTLLNILDFIRYGLIAFIGLGIFPTLFKKLNF